MAAMCRTLLLLTPETTQASKMPQQFQRELRIVDIFHTMSPLPQTVFFISNCSSAAEHPCSDTVNSLFQHCVATKHQVTQIQSVSKFPIFETAVKFLRFDVFEVKKRIALMLSV